MEYSIHGNVYICKHYANHIYKGYTRFIIIIVNTRQIFTIKICKEIFAIIMTLSANVIFVIAMSRKNYIEYWP